MGIEDIAGPSGESYKNCAVLVIIGAPRGTSFGINLKSWHLDDNFRGFKLLPPGIHYVHYAALDPHSDCLAPRIGFMHNFKSNELVVKFWDKENECIDMKDASQEIIEKISADLQNLDKYLAPYPDDIHMKWKSLTSYITEDLLIKLTPENGQIRSALDLISDDVKFVSRRIKKDLNNSEIKESNDTGENGASITQNTNKTEVSIIKNITEDQQIQNGKVKRRSHGLTLEEKEEELLPNMKPIPGTEIRFSEFPEKYYPPDATPSDITKHHLDRSFVLDVMIKNYNNPMDILGELEFAYICFLIGHSLEAFEYWKKLVNLFCSCEDALKKYRIIYLKFISILELQLAEIPEEFLADIVMNENFIYVCLRKFFKIVYSADIEPILKTTIERFQNDLTEQYMWNFKNLGVEEDDELPVIVHLD